MSAMKRNGKRSLGANFPRGALPRVSLAESSNGTFVAEATGFRHVPASRVAEQCFVLWDTAARERRGSAERRPYFRAHAAGIGGPLDSGAFDLRVGH